MKKLISLILFIISLSCTLVFVGGCGGNDTGNEGGGEHVCVYDQYVQTQDTLIREASCTMGAIYAKACVCGAVGPTPEYHYETDPTGHNWDTKAEIPYDGINHHRIRCLNNNCTEYLYEDCSTTKPATCVSDAYCDVCEQHISNYDPNNHTGEIKYVGYINNQHEIRCADCDITLETADCFGGTALCNSRATCELCNNPYGDFDYENHEEGNEWIALYGSHAKQCTRCYAWLTTVPCDFSNANCTTLGVCPTCNGVGSANPNVHSGELIWEYDDSYHTQKYDCCGTIGMYYETNHDFSGGEGKCVYCEYECKHDVSTIPPTCTTKSLCLICNTHFGDYRPDSHTEWYVWANHENQSTHSKLWPCCNTYEIVDQEHTWDEYGRCVDCRHWCEHEGGTSTCQTTAVCTNCDKHYGGLSNHIYNEKPEKNSDNYHSRYCKFGCGQYIELRACEGGIATCTSKPICDECETEYYEINPYNHTEADTWVSNGDNTHSLLCAYGCGKVYSTLDCEGGVATCSVKATCEHCNEQYGEFDNTNHKFSTLYYSNGDETHSFVCTYGCGAKSGTTACSGGIAWCTSPAHCMYCDSLYGESNPNNHYRDAVITIDNKTHHTISYSCCETSITLEHDFVNGTCETCTHACVHEGGTPTCSTLAVCDICQSRYGDYDEDSHLFVGNECEYCHFLTESQGLKFTKYSQTGGGYYYVLTGFGTNQDKNLVLPKTTYDGHAYQFPLNGLTNSYIESVTATGIPNFDLRDCENVKKVTLLDCSSIRIYNCPNLKEIEIAGTVGSLSISSCHSLENITFKPSATVNKISVSTCPKLTSLDLSNLNVKTIDNLAFLSNARLSYLNLGDTVETIGYGAFKNCMSLTKLVIPASVTQIDGDINDLLKPSAFTGCTKLLEIENYSSVEIKVNNNKTCVYKPNATQEEIDAGVKTESTIVIENGFAYDRNDPTLLLAYVDHAKTGTLVVPNTFTEIYTAAFAYCYNLTEIIIPTTVQEMQNEIFQGCTSLESLDIPFIDPMSTDDRWGGVANSFISYFGLCDYENNWTGQKGLMELFLDCTKVYSYDDDGRYAYVPSTLKKLTVQGGKLFSASGLRRMTMLEEITFVSFTNIPANMFSGITNLRVINLPSNLKSISDNFDGCVNLTHIIYPEGVSSIAGIGNCPSLMHVTIPSTAVTNQYYAPANGFSHLTSLVQVCNNSSYYTDSNFPYALNIYSSTCGSNKLVQEGNYIYFVDGEEKQIVRYLGNETELTIDSSVTGITGSAFFESNVTKITLPNGIKYIGASAFKNSALEEINLPDSIITIGANAFENSKLKGIVTLPKNLKEVPSRAFSGTLITNVVFPEGLEKIGDYAFSSCHNLLDAIIPESVKEIGMYAYYDCIAIETMYMQFVGRYADSSLNTTEKEKSIYYIFGLDSSIPSSITTLYVNFKYLNDNTKYYMFSSATNIIIGKNVLSIKAILSDYKSITFEEPALWTSNFGGEITAEQCNDGETALYYFTKDSNRWDAIWTKQTV